MDNSTLKAKARKKKRTLRIRNRISGTSQRPRLCVVKSNEHISVQVVDDVEGKTIVSLSSLSKKLKEKAKSTSSKTDSAKLIGEYVAKECLEKGINKAVLDRRGSKYHGVIAAFADAAREKGLQF